MLGPCGPDWTSLTIRFSSVVHATVGLLCWKPHTSVPATSSGVALRRHGPGVHSPTRQLSTDLPRSPDMRDRTGQRLESGDPPLRCAGRAKDRFKRGDWASA